MFSGPKIWFVEPKSTFLDSGLANNSLRSHLSPWRSLCGVCVLEPLDVMAQFKSVIYGLVGGTMIFSAINNAIACCPSLFCPVSFLP